MRYYSYDEFKVDVNKLAKEIKPYNPDVILAIARGGMTLGHFLSEALEMRDLYSINSIHYEETRKLDTINIFNIPDLSRAKRVVLVDDIIDSGETMIEIKRVLGEKYPEAELKVFVTASADVRAQRRYDELVTKGQAEDFEAVLANVKERDERDTNRVESPLKQAHDALLIDNSLLTKTEQRDLLRKWFDEKTR